MAPVDQFLLAFLALGVIIGLYRGFFREALGTVGLLLAVVAANFLAPVSRPYVGSVIRDDTVASVVVWTVVFLLAMFILRKVAYLCERLLRQLSLGWLSRLAGGLFGGVKYLLILALALTVVELASAHIEGLRLTAYLEESQLVPVVHRLVAILSPWASEHIVSPALNMLQ